MGSTPSPALLQANARLLEKRRQCSNGRQRSPQQAANFPPFSCPLSDSGVPGRNSNSRTWTLVNGSAQLRHLRHLAGIDKRTWELGTGKPAAINVPGDAYCDSRPSPSAKAGFLPPLLPGKLSQMSCRVFPSLVALVMRRNDGDELAAMRLWDILHSINREIGGPGWFDQIQVTKLLANKTTSPDSFIYGKRRLKHVLSKGEGVWWHRVKAKGKNTVRIRLVSRTKVARHYGIHLAGREVAFPLKQLFSSGRSSMAQIRSVYYAAWHVGRSKKRNKNPIARNTIAKISGCSPYQQRAYEARQRIKVKTNLAIVGDYDEYKLMRLKVYNRPAFSFTDYKGCVNPRRKGSTYIAVRLPSSYSSPGQYQPVSSRRQKVVNRKNAANIDDPCINGGEGNNNDLHTKPVFCSNVVEAYKQWQRYKSEDRFWAAGGSRTCRIWMQWKGEAT